MMHNKYKISLIVILIGINYIANCQLSASIANSEITLTNYSFLFNGKNYSFHIQKGPYDYFGIRRDYYKKNDELLFFRSPEESNKELYSINEVNEVETLISFFPLISTEDKFDSINNFLMNEYGILPMYPKIDTLYDVFNEFKYSYLLKNLKEPILYKLNNMKILRIVYSNEERILNKSYRSIRLNFENDSSKIFFSRIEFKGNEFILSEKFEKLVGSRDIISVNKILDKIHFSEEGVDCMCDNDEFLIEFLDGQDYYLLLRCDFHSARKYINRKSLNNFGLLRHKLKSLTLK